MPQAYFSLVTTAGKIKLAQSAAGGGPVVITHFGIGDGNGAETNPTAASTTLVHEVWRAPVESVVTDPENPSAILVTAIIPTTAGGWWMREFGVFDQAGTMIAVAKPVSQYKPTAAEGQLEDIRYEFQIIIGETANVALLVDPSLLFATRSWVESRKIPMGQLMRLPWLPVLSMTTAAPPIAPSVGDIYLIPTGATGEWATKIGSLAEWKGTAWNYITPPNGHGISLQDGRIFIRMGGAYVEKVALDVQSGKWSYVAATGTANAWLVDPTPALTAYAAGRVLWVVAPATNTSATVNVNMSGLGNRRIKKANGQDPEIGDIVSGAAYPTIDDGTNIRIIVPLRSDIRAASLSPQMIVKQTTIGAFSWTVPSGVFSIMTRLWGGGGGGGYSTNNGAASGGSAGAYAERRFLVTPGDTITGVVGAGGTGGSATPAQAGQPGLDSSLTVGGITVTAGGGPGGLNASTLGAVANAPSPSTFLNADFGVQGGRGFYGVVGYGPTAYGGNGGASPNGGNITMGGAGSAAAGQSPGGGAAASGNASFAGGTGARGEVHIIY